jgi:hypothetical protein
LPSELLNHNIDMVSITRFESDLKEVQLWDWEISTRLITWKDCNIPPFSTSQSFLSEMFLINVQRRDIKKYHENEGEFVGVWLTRVNRSGIARVNCSLKVFFVTKRMLDGLKGRFWIQTTIWLCYSMFVQFKCALSITSRDEIMDQFVECDSGRIIFFRKVNFLDRLCQILTVPRMLRISWLWKSGSAE